MNFTLSSIGLIFDIYGAVWLTRSIILRGAKNIQEETASCFSWNESAIQAQFKIKFEGWIGFSFLTLGFILQFLTQFLPCIKLSWLELFLIVVFLVAGAFGIEAFGRTIATKQSENLIKKIKKEQKEKLKI